MTLDTVVTRGSGNVFADIGVKNPEEALVKTKLILSLRQTIEDRGLTQVAAADLLGMKQPDLSKLLRGRTAGFSLERIIELVRLIGSDVEIRVKRSVRLKQGRLTIMLAKGVAAPAENNATPRRSRRTKSQAA